MFSSKRETSPSSAALGPSELHVFATASTCKRRHRHAFASKRVSLLLLLLPILCLAFYLQIVDFRVEHALHKAWAAATKLDLNELPEEAIAEDEEEIVNGKPLLLSEQAERLATEENSNSGDKCQDELGTENQTEQSKQTDTWWGRLKCHTSSAAKTSQCKLSQLPKYFDFDAFKRQFKRTYSKSEALFRKSIFLKKCFQIFKSRLAYRLGLTNYIQSINKFTDRSNSEIKRMFMAGPPIELRPTGQSKEDYLKEIRKVEEERIELEQAGLFAEFESQSSLLSTNDLNHLDTNELKFVNFDGLNYFNSLNEEKQQLVNDEEEQSATTIIHECKLKKKIQHLFSNTEDEELLKAIQDEIYDFKIETFSQTSSFNCEPKPLPKLFKYTTIVDSYDDEDDSKQENDNYEDENYNDNENERSLDSNKRKRVFNLDLNKLEAEQEGEEDSFVIQGKQKQFKKSTNNNELANIAYQEPKLKDECDSLDWSKHDCFHQIYDQGTKCGRCYVMASTSLAEFYKCNENESKLEKRKFSKDYVFNCGQKYSPTTILGCLGGSLLDTLKFISLAGIYNIRNWKSKLELEVEKLKSSIGGQSTVLTSSDLDLKCPFNQYEMPFNKWGQIKLNIKPVIVHTNNWFRMLKEGPIVVSIQMPSVELYESGVHDGFGCETSGNWHSMLLVGYGMNERRISYWKFRNSWGANWGEKGHFKLAMSVSGKCLAGGVRVIYRNKLPAELAAQ